MLALALAFVVAAEPPRLIVLNPVAAADLAGGIELARTLGEMAGTAAVDVGGFAVLSESDLKSALDFEANRQLMGCSEGSCLAEIAEGVDARFVISGRVSPLGTTTVIYLSLFDRDKTAAVKKTQTVLSTLSQAPAAVGEAVASLLGAARSALANKPLGTKVAGVEFVDVAASNLPMDDRLVPVPAFAIARTETTVEQYQSCVKAGACTVPDRSVSPSCNGADKAQHPVNCLTWMQARDFCRFLGGRLPESVEWRAAARGGRNVTYPWGDAPPDRTRVNYCDKNCPSVLTTQELSIWRENRWIDDGADDGFAATAPVGSFGAGNNALGLVDLAGNVYEMCANDQDVGTKVMHGGSYAFTPPWMRIDAVNRTRVTAASPFVGFRCVR